MRTPTQKQFAGLISLFLAFVWSSITAAQTRSMAQDASLNNLEHPPGYETAAPDTLGEVRTVGKGPRQVILIAGLGFGAAAYEEFATRRASAFTTRIVTLAGFGGTKAPPMPPAGTSYATTPWTDGATKAILAMMDQERIAKATLVAHWALSTQIAVRLASDHPDRFDAVVLIAGVPRMFYSAPPGMAAWTPEQRVKYSDGMAKGWFKTVTRRTWDDQNFMSYDYAVSPLRGLFLWREAATPTLPVLIRYLLEFYARDSAQALRTLRVPTLVLKPGFDDPAFFVDTGRDYMRDLTQRSFDGLTLSPAIEGVTISGARLFAMYDKPAEVDAATDAFLQAKGKLPGR